MSQALHIRTDSSSYPIYFGALHAMPPIDSAKKVLVVSNPIISKLYLESTLAHIKANEVFVCDIKEGEAHKNMASIESILDCAFANKLNRKSLMIALGGGVIGDMVGFASGIYERGIDFIQIPTTLLAQVDASVGGKTGINNAYGKNLVGLFHQPKAVYIDSNMLKTLPPREFSAGVAEIIKMAVCLDSAFFAYLQSHKLSCLDSTESKAALDYAIQTSVGLKANIVSQDEKEQGIRAVLNYGHTFGHVIENLTNYERYLHGEAVSIGICMANALSARLGLLNESESKAIKDLLQSYNLPTHFKIEDTQGFYNAFFLDKKSSDSKITFILPCGIGGFKIVDNVPKDIVLEVLHEFSKGEQEQ